MAIKFSTITTEDTALNRVQFNVAEALRHLENSVTSGSTGAAVSLAPVGAVPNGDGASLSAGVLRLQPADATHPGVVTTGSQSFSGDKVIIGTFAAHPNATAHLDFFTGYLGQNPTINADNPSGKVGGLLSGTSGTGYIFDNTGYFWVIADSPATIRGGTAGNSGVVLLQISGAGEVTTLKQVISPAFQLAYDGVTVPLSSGLGISLAGGLLLYQSGTLIGELLNGSWKPNTDNLTDLGSALKEFKDLYLSGTTSSAGHKIFGTDGSATAGNQTINKRCGKGKIASGATTCVISNNLITAASLVQITWEGNHGAARDWVTTVASTSFTVNLNAAAANDTVFNFVVLEIL